MFVNQKARAVCIRPFCIQRGRGRGGEGERGGDRVRENEQEVGDLDRADCVPCVKSKHSQSPERGKN